MLTLRQQDAIVKWYMWFHSTLAVQTFAASEASNDLYNSFREVRQQILDSPADTWTLELTDLQKLAIVLWCMDYRERLVCAIQRRAVSVDNLCVTNPHYSAREQELFESFGSVVEPFKI